MVTYAIPSHCESAVILEKAIMLVFAPIVVPFLYSTDESDADDYYDKYCADCSLRASHCRITGAYGSGNCKLNHYINTQTVMKSVQMPVPRHVLLFCIQGGDGHVRFGYETDEGIKSLRLSNIYGDGTWCRGTATKSQKDPSAIYNGYFNSIHNQDLTGIKPYDQYIIDLAEGKREIEDADIININRWGSIRNVVDNPTKIEWSDYEQDQNGFFRIRGYGYAKIS